MSAAGRRNSAVEVMRVYIVIASIIIMFHASQGLYQGTRGRSGG